MMKREATVSLLLTAAFLLLLAGCIFIFLRQMILALLLVVGGFCCAVATLNFRSAKSGREANRREQTDEVSQDEGGCS